MALDRIYRRRCILICAFLSVAFLGLVGRLVYLQGFQSERFRQRALHQQKISIRLEPRRGEILDSAGRLLALSVPAKTIYAIGSEIKDVEDTLRALSPHLPISDVLADRLRHKKGFSYVARKVEPDTADAIAALKLKGVYLQEDSKRVYPNSNLLSHVLGFVGMDGNGLEGLELKWDSHLRGVEGKRIAYRDASGREIAHLRDHVALPQDGCDLVLTIDEVIQHIAESELAAAYQKHRPESASIVVVNPKTGDILAMANAPDFDLNEGGNVPAGLRRNRAITDIFEPGSTFKMITASAALNEDLVDLADVFYCEQGSFPTAGKVLHDHNPHGDLSFRRILEVSSNIGMAKVALKIGKETLDEYVRRFGFGTRTHVALPGEAAGIYRDPEDWSKLSITRIPMGQEIAVTALQMAMAYGALANKGVLMKPRLVRQVLNPDGSVLSENRIEAVRRVMRPEVAAELSEALEGVLGPGGTARRARMEGYRVAGKTGTAQKIGPDGLYSKSDYMGSFAGFVPADAPELVVMVVLNAPKPRYYGGLVAAPVFRQVAGRTLKYLGIAPSRDIKLAGNYGDR